MNASKKLELINLILEDGCTNLKAATELRNALKEEAQNEAAKSAGNLTEVRAVKAIIKATKIGKAGLYHEGKYTYLCNRGLLAQLAHDLPLDYLDKPMITDSARLFNTSADIRHYFELITRMEIAAKVAGMANKVVRINDCFYNAAYLINLLAIMGDECVVYQIDSKPGFSNLYMISQNGENKAMLLPIHPNSIIDKDSIPVAAK